MPLELQSDIRYLKGVGESRALLYHKLGVDTVEDLLYHIPRRYIDLTHPTPLAEAIPGQKCAVRALLAAKGREQRIRRGLSVFRLTAVDGPVTLHITFFNAKYTVDSLCEGEEYLFYGTLTGGFYARQMDSPQVFRPEEAGTLLPVYPLTQGLSNKMVSRQVAEALHQVEQLPDPLAGSGLPRQYGLMSYSEALHAVHSPRDWAAIETGRSRMVFDELLCLTICFARMRQGRALRHIVPMQPHPLTAYYQALPYQLTGAQQRAIAEAIGDMCSGTPMNRLVQGDVGSGKTAVALLAAYWTIQNGYQAAMMAPTEVLARQHAASFRDLLEPAGITVVLLTGSLTAKEKRERLAQVADGTAQMVIGTHAVIQKGVEFQKLGLAITDEQHRFGVRQRSTLAEKGENVHTLVMTATPIPRTLALILYGDLDISIIDELPPGRQKIDTSAVDSRYHPRIYAFIEKHVAAGRQAYVICPMIEENEKLEVQSVLEYTAELTEELPHCRVACVHGKMKAKEKQTIMDSFAAGEIDVLVSTTVVEVGINVPNATIMLIENAERFGLAQLHQLRGRVGRGAEKSYCILVSDTKTKVAKERMKTMTESEDGFVISEKDLKLRGPGEFFGIRQHGLPELKIADLCRDLPILKEAQAAAAELLRKDRNLEQMEHQPLKVRIAGYLDGKRLEM